MRLEDINKLYGQHILDASLKYEIDPALIVAMIKCESNGNPKARSVCGAEGLMQLMPRTAADMGVDVTFNPRDNILGGTKYLAWLRDNFAGEDTEKLLAGYNAGPGRLEKDRWKNFKETTEYVKKVQKYMDEWKEHLKTEVLEVKEEIQVIEPKKKGIFARFIRWLSGK